MTELTVQNFGGFFDCFSPIVGTIHSTCDRFNYTFSPGVYILSGEIDSGNWAFSHSLCNSGSALLKDESKIYFCKRLVSLREMNCYTCDLGSKPISKALQLIEPTVKTRIKRNLKKYNRNQTVEEIRKLFDIDPERFDRPIHCVGNELFHCNAAIGYTSNKTIFCFPWLSNLKYQYYYGHIKFICKRLSDLGGIVLLPASNNIINPLCDSGIRFPTI